jgi:hypothetical protein
MGRPRREGSKQPNAAPSSAVTGADTAEELKLQADAAEAAALLGKKVPRGDSASTTRKRQELVAEAAEIRERQAALEELCGAIVPVPFELTAFMMKDPRWIIYAQRPSRIPDPARPNDPVPSRLQVMSITYARCLMAWGINFDGKWSALGAVVLVTGRVFANIGAEIASETPIEPAPAPSKATKQGDVLLTPEKP